MLPSNSTTDAELEQIARDASKLCTWAWHKSDLDVILAALKSVRDRSTQTPVSPAISPASSPDTHKSGVGITQAEKDLIIADYIDQNSINCDCCGHVMIDVTSVQTGEKQHCIAGDCEGDGVGCAHSFHEEIGKVEDERDQLRAQLKSAMAQSLPATDAKDTDARTQDALREQIAEMERQRGALTFRNCSVGGHAIYGPYFTDESGAARCELHEHRRIILDRGDRITILEDALREIAAATSEPGIAARVAIALDQPNAGSPAPSLPSVGIAGNRESEARQVAALTEALRSIQWGNSQWDPDSGENGTEYNLCPLCDQSEVRGHAPDCHVGAALDMAQPVLEPDAEPTLRETQEEGGE